MWSFSRLHRWGLDHGPFTASGYKFCLDKAANDNFANLQVGSRVPRPREMYVSIVWKGAALCALHQSHLPNPRESHPAMCDGVILLCRSC